MAERGVARDAGEILEAGIRELSLAATGRQLAQLLLLADLLKLWSSRISLTGHRTREAIVRSLILDAAGLSAELPELESLADVGSGAGFPAFPIAILRPECRLTLIESREKRHHFQREVARRLELGNVTLLLGRAEILPPTPHAAGIAQAAARPPDALELLIPWTRPGGLILIPGASSPPELPEDPRVDSASVVRYRTGSGVGRTLWMGRRR
jgi:16S rRNA (guanine527-N7)-methyltransferase